VSPLYVFCLTADEVLRVADISRVARDHGGDLIGYQRPEVRQHIEEIVDYLDGDEVVFPNPIILALAPNTRFTSSRGPKVFDGLACAGTIEIPLPDVDEPKPGWIVDGQQRALALARVKRRDFPVPVNAFVTHSVELQRDQFLRINNTRPLPRGLVTELLPAVKSTLPPRLSLRRTPSELCDVLNRDPESPFFGLIRRPSSGPAEKRSAVIADTSVVNMLKESFGPTGCLFLYRNTITSETDFDGVLTALYTYWHAIRETFPEAWGAKARDSRLMHGVGIRSMGRLMDRVLVAINPRRDGAPETIRKELEAIAPYCCWIRGRWEDLDLRWNELQNVPRHINELSNYLLRLHAALKEGAA
jgi:DGQHR domain-containing protein